MSSYLERLLRSGFGFLLFWGFADSVVEAAPPALNLRPSVVRPRGAIRLGARHALPTSVSDSIRLSLPRKVTSGPGSQRDALSHLEELLAVLKQDARFEPGFEASYRSLGNWLEGKFLVHGPKIHFEFPQNPLAPLRGRYTAESERFRIEQAFERICMALADADLPALWALESRGSGARVRRALERLVEIYTAAASAMLESRGIPHRITSVGGRDAASLRIVISPDRKASPLNRFASSMQDRGFETIVDPGGMILDATGGWMSAAERVIAISHRDLLRGTLSKELAAFRAADIKDLSLTARSIRESGGAPLGSVSLHELRHFSQLRKLERGEASVLHGEFQSSGNALPGTRPGDAYADYLAADELDAYHFEARVDARRLRRVLELPESDTRDRTMASLVEGLTLIAEQGSGLAQRVEAMSQVALVEMQKGARASVESAGGMNYVRLEITGQGRSGVASWDVRFPLGKAQAGRERGDPQGICRERLIELERYARSRVEAFGALELELREISGLRSVALRESRMRDLLRLLPAESDVQ